MSDDIIIYHSRDLLDSERRVGKVIIYPGATVSAEKSIDITAEGDISILGSLRAQPGESITLKSLNGAVTIWGVVISGRGLDGSHQGASGQPGGNVTLISEQGAVSVMGAIVSGVGGNGIDDRNGLNKRGGDGKKGGDITLKAVIIDTKGSITAGDGGEGGKAVANELEHSNLEDRENVPPPPGPPGFINEELESDELGGVVEHVIAIGGNGGHGGKIHMDFDQFFSKKRAEIISGDGGNSGGTEATGGVTSVAESGTPGDGGNIIFRHRLATSPPIEPKEYVITLGSGGSASGAFSAAKMRAISIVRNGGEPGKLSAHMLPNSVFNKGTGGDSEAAVAKTPNSENSKSIREGSVDDPGTGVTVDAN